MSAIDPSVSSGMRQRRCRKLAYRSFPHIDPLPLLHTLKLLKLLGRHWSSIQPIVSVQIVHVVVDGLCHYVKCQEMAGKKRFAVQSTLCFTDELLDAEEVSINVVVS